MPVLNSQLFANNELTSHAKWVARVFTPISNAFLAFWGDNTWRAGTLTGSWVAAGGTFATPSYRIRDGMVYLKGAVKNGNVGPAVIFNLPVGFRPSTLHTYIGSANTGNARIDVNTNGDVSLTAYFDTGSNANDVHLDNVRFLVG